MKWRWLYPIRINHTVWNTRTGHTGFTTVRLFNLPVLWWQRTHPWP